MHPQGPVPLGDEPLRYYQLAADDAAAEPSPIDQRLLRVGARRMSTPLLPQAPAGHDDRKHHVVLRTVLEDLAKCKVPENATTADMVDVLAAVDTTPVGYRSDLGGDIVAWLHDVAQVDDDGLKWQFRIVNGNDRVNLIFAAVSRHDEMAQALFGSYISLRHQQLLEAIPEQADALTVGVLLTPRRDDTRPWDTTMVATRGDQGFDPPYRADLEAIWGQPGALLSPRNKLSPR
ncbi:hypothetical protein PSN13_05172 [Micromonospora saelicesensis]|uniref:Uncharacterized protein n=1 Tax=Micromonospora saelicesensis TaxID=285676 RepID=A0A328NMP2_9ACTN|nr:hypothetical protein [Micromonospora saelicesensis]RAO29973.1 hypothetical protein PSN13_05172 [Micromonospora saelicesensis]